MGKRIAVTLIFTIVLAAFGSAAFAQEGKYEVVWPRAKTVVKIMPLAQRIDTLKGKTVCELWDDLFRGDEIFPMIEKNLSKKYPGIKFVNFKEFGSTHGKDEKAVLDSFREKFAKYRCDAVVSGVGC